MSENVNKQTCETNEHLRNELRAIEYWDATYRKKRLPTPSDDQAFTTRQERRTEINCKLEGNLLP